MHMVCICMRVCAECGILVYMKKSYERQVPRDRQVSFGQIEDGKKQSVFSFLVFLNGLIFIISTCHFYSKKETITKKKKTDCVLPKFIC